MKTKMMLALAASFILLSGTAFAFHGGGVAHCDGCHSMHNSADNPRLGSATSAALMKGSDASSTCLNCHEGSASSYHIKTAVGDGVNGGGDFFWVSAAAAHDFTDHTGTNMQDPNNKGHNVIALDFGLVVDPVNTMAPGGSSPANTLGCTSCHDPHGQVNGGTSAGTAAISGSGSYGAPAPVDGSILGNYRLLGDAAYKTITAPAPVAASNGFGPNQFGALTRYGTGMSAWCLSCHPNYNDSANMHPVDTAVPVAYNSYVASGDFTGVVATAYDGLVPIERNTADATTLTPGSTAGVVGPEQVMCLSCHRAHASAFENALRWDNSQEFLVDSKILNEATTTVLANGAIPYFSDGAVVDIATDYGQYQRQLCNKCHAKD